MRVIERTWASVEVPGVETLFYLGGSATTTRGRRLTLPEPDDLANVGKKTLACFEHVLEHRRFDVVFRTNCSSYVDLPNLRSYVDAHARPARYYAGVIGLDGATRFASGSGYFLSRDLVELVVCERAVWDHSRLDDVALGALLARGGVEPEPAPRLDYRQRENVRDVDTSQFHFRCRTASRWRLGDVAAMVALHRVFCEARGCRLRLDARTFDAGNRAVTSVRSHLLGPRA